MRLAATNLSLPFNADESALMMLLASELRVKQEDIQSLRITRHSLDARDKADIRSIYSVSFELSTENAKRVALLGLKNVGKLPERSEREPEQGTVPQDAPAVVVGLGPAGLFAAHELAKRGYKVIVIERGKPIAERKADVETFFSQGLLNTNSNVMFGEGGAGTFSDGKLTTRIKDPRAEDVIDTLVKFGADGNIAVEAKPHIGTDVLCRVVRNIREEIIRLGGEVRFNTFFENFECADGHLSSVSTRNVRTGQCERIDTDHLIIALGHSSRDTFRMLYERNIDMIPKAFAVGVRIEHPQSLIDHNAYGDTSYRLPAADYKLTHQTDKGRGVYSFCMCPGGYVVNASSEDGMTAVNGMSYSGRDSSNANSAIIVTVTPDDYRFPGHELSPLDGVEFQRNLERAAYEAGGGLVPVQLLGDFISNVESTELGSVTPNIKGCYRLANVRKVLPAFVGDSIAESIPAFARSIHGYDMADAVVSGVESRTSSPLRIIRNNDTFESNIHGIYPCGEGAGYAGGITSAAMDGIKVAEKCALSIYSKIRI